MSRLRKIKLRQIQTQARQRAIARAAFGGRRGVSRRASGRHAPARYR